MYFFSRISLIVGLVFALNTIMFSAPVPASCTPITLNYCCGFGITNVSFGTINNNSNDGVDGYSDFTALTTNVLEGQTYNLSIQTTAPNSSNQNYAAWIDFNNDGVLDDVTERVATVSSQLNTVVSITIPTGAVLNTDLRLRIAADFNLSAAPTPCTDLDRGQAEDYTVVILPNPNPPIVSFSASDTLVCDGAVCFTDNSQNIPTSWLWYFGDGTTSFQQNPCHTYTADGTYTVSLVATNANGTDSDTITNYITVNMGGQVTASGCNPSTTSYCCGYGITGVSFADISNTTPDGQEGYQDFSCTNSTTLVEGNGYPITVTTGVSNPQDIRVWIDYDNDGVFNNSNELVMDAPNSFSPTQTIQIPFGVLLNTPLRLRISADIVGVAQTACDNNDRGQTEDYGIVITDPSDINELTNKEEIKIFPNPVTGILNVSTPQLNVLDYELYIYNSIGQQVLYLQEVNKGNSRIDVSNYPKGAYFLTVKSGATITTKKVIIY